MTFGVLKILDNLVLTQNSSSHTVDKVQGIILNFSNHPGIFKIIEKFELSKIFSFQHVSEVIVRKVMKNVPSDKVSAGEIPKREVNLVFLR